MKDRRGIEIKVGDIAVHASSGRYGAYDVVRVSGFTEKMVVVDRVDYMDPRYPVCAATTNLTPGTLIVASLPPIADRLS